MNIQCAIFDFDGTLFDSMPIWETIGARYLRALGMEPKPSLCEDVRALSLRQAACYLKETYALSASPKEIEDGILHRLADFYLYEVLPKPGVGTFLKRLRAKKIRMCIATASDRTQVEAALRRCGMLQYFDAIFTCAEVGSGKDSPAIFRTAIAQLGAVREHTIVFEDALHAVKTAKADGFVVVAVADASEKQQEELRALADAYMTDFEDTTAVWQMLSAV